MKDFVGRRTARCETLEPRTLLSSVPLHVSGTVLNDPDGNTVRLRGVNIDSLEYDVKGDHILQSVDVALHDWHATLIRLPMNQDFWFGYNYSPNQAADQGAGYRALVDQIVNTVAQNNAHVVLDLHWSDAGQWGMNIGQHRMPDDHSTLFWQSVAAKYADNPAVFFDPYNEPHDVTWSVWRNGGTVTEPDTGLTYHSPGMQGLLDTIRAAGTSNIVVASGNDYAADFLGVTHGFALTDPTGNLMYQAHLYPYDTSGQTDAQRDAGVAAVAAKYPLYVGEFGTDANGTNSHFIGLPTASGWTQTMLAWLDRHQYSWTAWSFNPQTHPILLNDWNYTPTSYYGVYVKNALAVPIPGPRVTGVLVGGTTWAQPFHSVPAGAHQLDDLPWVNIDQVRVKFNENVSVRQASLVLAGSSGAIYPVKAFEFDPISFTATWTLSAPLPADHVRLSLTGVRDASGYALDGEWSDGTASFPSGDGAAGGPFVFDFNVLPGDADQNGSVGFSDLLLLAQSFGSPSAPSPFVDLNGDRTINFDDLLSLVQRYGRSLT